MLGTGPHDPESTLCEPRACEPRACVTSGCPRQGLYVFGAPSDSNPALLVVQEWVLSRQAPPGDKYHKIAKSQMQKLHNELKHIYIYIKTFIIAFNWGMKKQKKNSLFVLPKDKTLFPLNFAKSKETVAHFI